MRECLDVIIENHLEPLTEAAKAGRDVVERNAKAKKGSGDTQIDAQTLKNIRYQVNQGLGGSAVEQDDQGEDPDPLLRYLTLSSELNALADIAKSQVTMSGNPWQHMADQFSSRLKPTEAQKKRLIKILDPTGAAAAARKNEAASTSS